MRRALTHSSYANELGDVAESNERLEFLGDAVLDLVVSELLMEASHAAQEGVLSRARAAAVNSRALAIRARELRLGRFVRLSKGEEQSGGGEKESILANVFEAVVGALYLDGGLPAVRALVVREFGDQLSQPIPDLVDPKTRLQELLQARGEPVPRYRLSEQSGPPHSRVFSCEAYTGEQVLGVGTGRSKRAAEQDAARSALEAIEAPGR